MESKTKKQVKGTKESKPIFDMRGEWTPEKKAALRKTLPEKLNKYGEWIFSAAGGKVYLIVSEWQEVLKRDCPLTQA